MTAKKRAIVFTGFTRGLSRDRYENFKKYLPLEDADIYCSTWEENGSEDFFYREEDFYKIFGENLKGATFLKEEDFLEEEEFDFIDREDDFFKTVNSPDWKPFGSVAFAAMASIGCWRRQYYCVREGLGLLSNYSDYDIIYRIRFDVTFENSHSLADEYDRPFIKIPHGISPAKYAPTDGHTYCVEASGYGKIWPAVNDHLAYGSSELMKKYFEYFDYMFKIYEEHNVSPHCPEHSLGFYLLEYLNLPLEIDDDIQYDLDYEMSKNHFPSIEKATHMTRVILKLEQDTAKDEDEIKLQKKLIIKAEKNLKHLILKYPRLPDLVASTALKEGEDAALLSERISKIL